MILDRFTRAYLDAALWSSTDEDGKPLDSNYSIEDFAEEALARAVSDCARFRAENRKDLLYVDPEQAGHDFWLTRNRHGAGFWTRGLGDQGRRLTDAAHVWGEVYLFVADGKIHYEGSKR